MISINVNVERAIPKTNEDALTLVVFMNALADSGNESNPIRINSLTELYAAFQDPTTLVQFKELYMAEYLIRAGVNLLCYTVDTPGTFDSDDLANISDIDVLGYKFIVVPYEFVESTNYSTSNLKVLVDFVSSSVTIIDAQLFLDIDPFADSTEADAVLAAIEGSAKIEACVNSGFASFTSGFTVPTRTVGEETITYSLTEAYVASDGTYVAATDFVGIPSSLAIVARKAKLIAEGTPWLPVAGERYGIVPEFVSLFRALSTAEKEAFQADNMNVLITRRGVGNIFVSQNTMYDTAEVATNPLFRSHVVTEALWIKRQLEAIALSTEQLPNNQKTWDSVSLKLKDMFRSILEQDGITSYQVYIGRNVTMTDEDIANGILKVTVNYVPIRVIESIVFNVTVQQSADVYDVVLSGGEL